MTYKHVHSDYHYLFNKSDAERIIFMDQDRWIGYKLALKIIAHMRKKMTALPRGRVISTLVTSNPNNGKTSIINRFKSIYGEDFVNDDSEPVKPVIVAKAFAKADLKSLFVSILDRFWAPYKLSSSILKLNFQVLHLLKTFHVKILIFDEIQFILNGTNRNQREIMNALKSLGNELRIPIVCFGTEDSTSIFNADQQIASRFEVIELINWEIDTNEDMKEYQRLLARFETILPLKKASSLHQAAIAKELHTISGGNLGNLHRLLIECATQAINDGTEQITMEIINSKSWLKPTDKAVKVQL